MNQQEKINAVARELCNYPNVCTCTERDGHCSTPQHYAKAVVELGYRKEEEIVAEVLKELEDTINPASKSFESFMLRNKIHKLKEKYKLK